MRRLFLLIFISAATAFNQTKIDPSQIKQSGATSGQALTWNGSQWAPGQALSTSAGYNFAAQTPGGSLTGSMPATVTLSPCPLGVAGSDTYHYLYVSAGTTGAPEAVLITGGTCTAGAASGTVTFTPANSHSGAWTIQSATAGIQEAILSAVSPIFVPPGNYSIYGTISVGNGTATNSSAGTASTYTGVRVFGAGAGDETLPGTYGTKLTWAGAANGNPIVIRGPIYGVEISGIKVDGGGTSGDLVSNYYGFRGYLHDLVIGNGGANTYAMQLYFGSTNNIVDNVTAVQNYSSGASGFAVAKAPNTVLGVSQNVFRRVYALFENDKPTSVGFWLEGADNNTFEQCNAYGGKWIVSAASNASPIQITTSTPIPGIATGNKIQIFNVAGNTAANNTLSNPYWTITVIDSSHFTLNTSTGNGAYTSGGDIFGPGSALYLKTNTITPSIPLENGFYNCSFQRGLITDDVTNGNHGPNFMLPFPASDGELLNFSSSAWNGMAHPEYYITTYDGYSRVLGKQKYVDSATNILGYAKFNPDYRELLIGDGLESLGNVNSDLYITRTSNDATATVNTNTSGNSELILQNSGNNGYSLIADRSANILRLNTNSMDVLTASPVSGAAGIRAVSFSSLPSIGSSGTAAGSMLYCTNCTVAATCASGGSGHMAVSNGTNWTCQ